MAGVLLPVVPVRRQIGFTGPLMQPMPTVPFTLDLGSTLYFHNAGDGLLLGISDAGQRPGFGGISPMSGWQPSIRRQLSSPRLSSA
jgi:sarcosine oxidase subunit beta